MSQLVVIDKDTLFIMLNDLIGAALKENLPYTSPKVNGNPKVYTRKEAAGLLKCTPNTVTKYIRQGKLDATPLNGQYRINEKQLQELINNKK